MSRIFLIHGAGGNPEENWFPWLKKELENGGHEVIIPRFPIGTDQTLQNWQHAFEPYAAQWNEGCIIIGHSLGTPFLLRHLEKHPARAAIFVAGFGEYFPELAPFRTETFLSTPFNWQRIKNNCSQFFIFQGDNDPYIPLKIAKNLANNLGVNVRVIRGAGHFNAAAGYIKFETLADLLKSN